MARGPFMRFLEKPIRINLLTFNPSSLNAFERSVTMSATNTLSLQTTPFGLLVKNFFFSQSNTYTSQGQCFRVYELNEEQMSVFLKALDTIDLNKREGIGQQHRTDPGIVCNATTGQPHV